MLIVENIVAGYGSTEVLKNVSFQAAPGEIHGILGVNGSGKTTLFRTINGWLPKWGGRLTLKDQPLTTQQISFLETKPYFYPFMKGQEYLELLKLKNASYQIDSWNEIFQLPLDRLAEDYSTGMKKKLALLGILAQDRPMLILDEPFSGVDIESNEKFQEILLRLKQQGKIILLSSHLLQLLTEVCDQVSFLSNGQMEKTYVKNEFPALEDLIKLQIKSKLDGQLDQLFSTEA